LRLTQRHHDEGRLVAPVLGHRLRWTLDLGDVEDGVDDRKRLLLLFSGIRIDFDLLYPADDVGRPLSLLDTALVLIPCPE